MEPGAGAGLAAGLTDSDPSGRLYSDVEAEYYDEDKAGPAGAVYDSVNRLRELGIFEDTDCGDNKFCPDNPVDRKTFAVWLVRVLDGDDAPDFVKKGQSFKTRFEDIPKSYPEGKLIERLAELEITSGCSLEPARYCPDGTIPRSQLATFISRALALPEADPIGFWDVEEGNYYFDHVNRLVAAGIDDGCSEVRFTPFNFCPSQIVSRGELAELLSEVVDYIEAEKIIRITEDSKPDNSIGLSVSFEEVHGWSEKIKVTWTNPKNKRGGVSHYILQWRPSWDGFNYRRYQVVGYNEKGSYEVELPRTPSSKIYAFRVIVAYSNENEDHLATDEVKMANKSHKLQDAIEEHIIDTYGEDQSWLVDAWRYSSGPALSVYPRGNRSGVSRFSTGDYNQLQQTAAGSLTLSHDLASDLVSGNFNRRGDIGIVIHELGHVYTITNGIAKNEASIAIGHLYLGILDEDHSTRPCDPDELYASLAMAAFHGGISLETSSSPNDWGSHWSNCRFNLNQEASSRVLKDLRDITQKVFLDREKIPQWFYDEYQKGDGSINLDKLWADILRLSTQEKTLVIYGLRNEFGGYCSTEDLYRLHIGEIDSLDTPWKDAGGCPTETEIEPTEEKVTLKLTLSPGLRAKIS